MLWLGPSMDFSRLHGGGGKAVRLGLKQPSHRCRITPPSVARPIDRQIASGPAPPCDQKKTPGTTGASLGEARAVIPGEKVDFGEFGERDPGSPPHGWMVARVLGRPQWSPRRLLSF